jgi:NaMN:DMB phosphoribosyltransferase
MDITLNTGHVTPAGLWWATGHDLDDPRIRSMIRAGQKPMMGAASIGDAVENKVLDHLVANATYTAPAPFLGLWTSTLTDASTAATAGELTYTTYARQSVSATNMSPAASGSVTNDVAITFAAVTAGGGTVTAI